MNRSFFSGWPTDAASWRVFSNPNFAPNSLRLYKNSMASAYDIRSNQRFLVKPRVGCGDEPFEQRMRLVGFAVEFGMKLAGDVEGVVGKLDDLDQLAIRREPAQDESRFVELFPIDIVELVSMPVAFLDNESAV